MQRCLGVLCEFSKSILQVDACVNKPSAPVNMQYYIRGAWRTISDKQPADRSTVQKAETGSQSQDRDLQGTASANNAAATRVEQRASSKAYGFVKRELSDELKESSAFLRDTEGDWEAVLRRIASRQGSDINRQKASSIQATQESSSRENSQ